MLHFSLISDSAQQNFRYDVSLHFPWLGLASVQYCFCGVELCRNEGKCVRKAFQDAGLTSCCIFHLLVLPLLSCWGRWVTNTHSHPSSHLLSFALFHLYLWCSLVAYFLLYCINFSPRLQPLSSTPLESGKVSFPWQMRRPLIGINDCAFISFSSLLGGAKSDLNREAESEKEAEGVRSEKWDKKEWDSHRLREIGHQAALCSLLGR